MKNPNPEFLVKLACGDVVLVAGAQARLTHNTVGGITSACIVALMSHYALYTDEPLSGLSDWLKTRLPYTDFPRWSGRVKGPGVGMNTALAVLTLLQEQTSLLDIARTALMWGGDTDSVLPIAWGIASSRIKEDLPPFFKSNLEPTGIYGHDFLLDLGTKLMSKFGVPDRSDD